MRSTLALVLIVVCGCGCTPVGPEPDAGGVDSGTFDGGAIDGDTADSGAIDGGPLDGGAVDDGSVGDGPLHDGSVDDAAAMDDSSVDDATMDDGAVDDAAMDDAAMDDAAMDDAAMDDAAVGDAGLDMRVQLRGSVQKGPFVVGSSLAISEIDSAGNPTGVVFNTTTTNDLGEFAVDFSYLGAVSLEANGFYYNEAMGALSSAPLTLRAFHEITSGGAQGAYVNLVTHLAYGRVRRLVDGGSTIASATEQAERELRAELRIGPAGFVPEAAGIYLNELGGDSDSNAYLLAVSAVLTRARLASGTDAVLLELLNTISADLAPDGRLGDALKAEIDVAQRLVDGDAVMTAFRARLAAIGSSAVLPNIHRMLDTDRDGVVNASDNCPRVPNPGQENTSGGAYGDACADSMLGVAPSWTATDAPTIAGAWGDVDGDGDLDLATASGPYADQGGLYRNDGGTLTNSTVWRTGEVDNTFAAAWGDVDRDGDLDLVLAGTQLRVYRNDAGTLTATAVWSNSDYAFMVGAAWGDVDGDGDLDLAAATEALGCVLYRNDGGVLTSAAVWSTSADAYGSVAWGDVDGDGDLDLATGGYQANLYVNDGAALALVPAWTSPDPIWTGGGWQVAWGDVDGDGDLDLATSSYLYRNDGGTMTATAVWISSEPPTSARAVAWGDVDADGDLDLAVGLDRTSVFLNLGTTLAGSRTWSGNGGGTASVAWGDVDGDGDLDLAAGGRVYRNNFR